MKVKGSKSCSVVSDSLRPHGLYSPWNSPGQNTGVGSRSLLQGIFPIQGLNPGLPYHRKILYQLSHRKAQDPHVHVQRLAFLIWIKFYLLKYRYFGKKIRLRCRRPQFDSWVGKIFWRRERLPSPVFLGFPCGSGGKESIINAGDLGLIPWVWKIPWRSERLPTPVFWPGEFHGLYSPWGRKESDTTERLPLPLSQVFYNVVSFCCVAKWISYMYTYIHIFFFFRFPSNLGHHRALSKVPCSQELVLVRVRLIYFILIHSSVSTSFSISQFLPFSPPHLGNCKFVLHIYDSVSALQISSSLPFCGHVWMWELDCEEGWVPKNWCFWTVVLEKTLESPLDCKEIQPVHPEGDQSWVFIGRTDAEAETPILWPPDATSWLIGKDSDAGRDWGQEEKGMTEDEMPGWHHWLDGHESEWTPGVCDGQGGLARCNSWGRKESDTTVWLKWTELNLPFF